MKPTKAQLADPKWWDENSGGFHFLYECESTSEIVFANREGKDGNGMRLRLELDIWKLLAKRPEPEILDTDWLKEGVNVTTPKGIAEVRRVTEDDGVYTSLGNFCRSELSEVKPGKWKPEVGVECCGNTTDAAGNWSWQKVEPLKDMGNGEFACYTENKILRFVDQFRPTKTQREELINLVATALQTDDQDVTELCNKSKSMFMSGATKLVDAILARFDLTEKYGE